MEKESHMEAQTELPGTELIKIDVYDDSRSGGCLSGG